MPCRNRYDLPVNLIVRTTITDTSTNTKQQASSNIILTSRPYMISNTHTITYYRPNFANFIVLEVKNFNQEPVSNVPINVKINNRYGYEIKSYEISNESTLKTDANGLAIVTFSLTESIGRLRVTATTNDTKYDQADQAFIAFNMIPFDKNENAAIWIANKKQLFYSAGDKFHSSIDYSKHIEPGSLFWIASSKGYIFHHEKITSKQIDFNITNQMAPSVRILVLAITNNEKVVSDSILIYVEQKNCGVKIELDSKENTTIFEPGTEIKFRFEGNDNDIVAMNAVDESVYILRNKSVKAKFQKILQSHDIGNGPGGGKSSLHIIDTAGFKILQMNKEKYRNKRSTDETCLLFDHTCCRMALLRTKKSCSERSKIIKKYALKPECVTFFDQCCLCRWDDGLQTSSVNRPETSKSQPSYELNLPRPYDRPIEQEIDEKNTRYDFRDSWLFDLILLNKSFQSHTKQAPHSITSWIISSISLSQKDGLCFAKDQRITTYKPFFVHVSMAQFLILNEHTEVSATIFNYLDENLRVKIHFYKNDEICSEASDKIEKSEILLNIKAKSSMTKSFPIVPIKIGTFTIKLKASAYIRNKYISDIIMKNITVRFPGKVIEEATSLDLDPGNRAKRETTIFTEKPTNRITSKVYPEKQLQKIDILFQKNVEKKNPDVEIVPGTMRHKLSLIGSKFNPSIKSIEELDHLIKKPKGCGEQNMYFMAFNLYTMNYLKQMGKLKESTEIRALNYLKRALRQELNFRKEDGSFSAFVNRESSIWLTAFISKVFCQSGTLLREYMDNEIIVSAIKWLLEKQSSDGSWKEIFPILHEKALGGTNQGSHTLTAYIIIALNECQKYLRKIDVPHDLNLNEKILLAQEYLHKKFKFFDENSYSLSIITYSLISRQSIHDKTNELIVKLMNHDDKKRDNKSNHFYYNNDYSIETTSYVLLSLAEYIPKDELTDSLANFLTLQQKDGAFDNTQDTIVALEALASYYSKIQSHINDYKLMSNISFNYRPKRSIEFTEENNDLLHIIDVEKNTDNVDIVTLGNGLGKIELLTTYNVLNPNDKCHFELSIRLSNVRNQHRKEISNYDGDLFFDVPVTNVMQEQGIIITSNYNEKHQVSSNICDHDFNHKIRTRSIWTNMRNRFRPQNITNPTQNINEKQTAKENSDECSASFDAPPNLGIENPIIRIINVSFRRLNDDENGMVILEVGLLSGYKVIRSDLDKLLEKKNILNYNSADSKIEFYLKNVPYAKRESICFRIYQQNIVLESQGALVSIYDYYQKDSSCSKLYNDTNINDEDLEFEIHDCNGILPLKICSCKILKVCPGKLGEGLEESYHKNSLEALKSYKKLVCKHFSAIIEGIVEKKENKTQLGKFLVHLQVLKVIQTDLDEQFLYTEGERWPFYLDKICNLCRKNERILILIRKGKNDNNGIQLIDGQSILYESTNDDHKGLSWLNDLNAMLENEPCF
ncbi:venom factor isoform X2 [Dermatophagoides farinae]